MKKFIYIFGALALIFSSCSNDENSNVPILPVKVVQTYENGREFIMNHKYDGNKWLGFRSENGGKADVVYEGDLIKTIKYYFGTELTQEDLYTYDNNQKLSKFIRNEYGDKALEYVEELRYSYNNDGSISYSKYNKYTSNGQLSLTSTGTITLNSLGEIILVEDSLDGKIKYIYDDKKSPFINILGIEKTFLSDSQPQFGMHNILKVEGNNVETNTFTYNSNDFPISKESFDGFEKMKYAYFYNK